MNETIERAWRDHRPYLVNLAYQLLGDVGESEDVAQEAFLRLSRNDPDSIEDVRGWLTVVASRLCLDQVRSARVRRESPADPSVLEASGGPDPADRVTLDDEVRSALTAVLDRLNPGERVTSILHDVFQVPFDEIAAVVGRPVGTCRQLARRARGKIHDTGSQAMPACSTANQDVATAFITACANGDIEGLTALLDPDVWGVGTVLADPAPPPQVNHGRQDVARNLLRYLGPGATVVAAPSPAPVLLAFADHHLFAVVVLTIRDGLILKIEATADPSARTRN
jgi:RNA polymerase sigma-70 factor, ECF subfamily